jgi:hypothetical protein
MSNNEERFTEQRILHQVFSSYRSLDTFAWLLRSVFDLMRLHDKYGVIQVLCAPLSDFCHFLKLYVVGTFLHSSGRHKAYFC